MCGGGGGGIMAEYVGNCAGKCVSEFVGGYLVGGWGACRCTCAFSCACACGYGCGLYIEYVFTCLQLYIDAIKCACFSNCTSYMYMICG